MHEQMETQSERILRQHLGRVTAPAELWQRVQGGKPRPAAAPRFQMASAAAAFGAVMVMAVAGWSMWRSSSQPLEIHSASASEVRDWVRENSGLDVPLAAKPSSLVEILGASIDRAGKLIAIVSYRVGEIRATLLVSKAAGGDTPHKGTEAASTWTMGGQSYTLAVAGPGDLRTACLLCHSSPVAALY